jgi:two-component system, OmpR family, phosphate regulon sensor histidine kinase PhoR
LLHEWRVVIKQLLIITALLSLVGILTGEVTSILAVGIAIYLLHTLFQLRRLSVWLHSARNTPPPEARGIWGDIFDDIYKMQRREAQAVNHFKGILDKAQESTAALKIAVVMINSKDNLEWWNNAAEKLLGFKAPQDQRQAITNLIRDPAFIEYFQGQNFITPLQMASPVNSRTMLEFQITMFGAGEKLIMVRDITQISKLENMRTDFIANVSHELRTPITVISGYLETLLDQQESIAQRWVKPLEQMYQQSRKMENIIHDLLTLSRLETNSPSKKHSSVHINTLLYEIVADAKHAYAHRNQTFEIQCNTDYNITGNAQELYSAFSNLVLNAARYTPDNGSIIVRCNADKDAFIIEVQDNGIGIASQHIPRLTERFYRVDESRSTETGGTGLGLAIVKHSLARHDATLIIFSEPGKGSRFVCQFPAKRIVKAPEVNTAQASGH